MEESCVEIIIFGFIFPAYYQRLVFEELFKQRQILNPLILKAADY